MTIQLLLQRFIDDELGRVPALVERILAGTRQLLGDADGGSDAAERVHHGEIIGAIRTGSGQYLQAFLDSLARQISEESSPPLDVPPARSGPAHLELMDEIRIDVDIEISRAAELIDATAEWELRELQTYTSTLRGERHVTAESNPFSPQVYALALWEAACATVPSRVQRAIVLRTSAGVAAGLLKSAWAAASTRLESQGVRPGTYRTLTLPSGAAVGRAASSAVETPDGLTSLLAKMPMPPDTSPTQGGDSEGPDGVGQQDLLAPKRDLDLGLDRAILRLDEWLRHAMFETSRTGRGAERSDAMDDQRAALVASASAPLDRQVIGLVTRLFEAIDGDPELPAPFRSVFSRMQVACLRLALAEPATLDSFEHPAWRLFNRIGEASVGCSRLEDPRLAAFLVFARAVSEEMAGASSPDTALFQRGLDRIDRFLAEQLQDGLHAAGETVASLQLAERRDALQFHVAQRITDLMAPVRATPLIRRFMTGTWSRVIAEDMLRHGEQSDETLRDARTVDEVLWSLKVPDHPRSRQRLVVLLPDLLGRLRSGMNLVAVPEVEQGAVLDELMAIHTEALRPRARGGSGEDDSPDEIVRRMREEIVPDTPRTRSFSDSVIDLSSMETVPASEMAPPGGTDAHADPAARIEALRAGDRLRVFLLGRWNRVRLLWRSDRSLFFLFAGDSPVRTHSITRRALERLHSAGLVQPLEGKPLVQRSAQRMLRQLAPRP